MSAWEVTTERGRWSALQPLCSALLGIDFDDADCARVLDMLEQRPASERAQFSAFMHLVQHATLLRLRPARFNRLDRGAREQIVARWLERAPSAIRRGLTSLKSLAALAHYGAEKSWARVGYDGPWLGRINIQVFPDLIPGVTEPSSEMDVNADVCVIGTGAGGAAAAARLTERGLRVVALECGPHITAAQYTQRDREMLPLLYAERFLRATSDQAIGLLQGRGVGGSTLHNTGLVVGPPPGILARWQECGLGYAPAEIENAAAIVKEKLQAVPIAEARINRNNALLRAGAERLGYSYFVAQHNRLECSGCGYCMLGCAYNRKVNAAGAFLLPAVANGLTIVADAAVQLFSGTRDRFVVHAITRAGPLRVKCRRVVLAASAMETPILLRRSGVRSDQVGSRLRLHPSALVYAAFDERVEAWRGVPQAVLVNEFASFERDGHGGFLILPNPANTPALVAVTAPGTGKPHHDLVGKYPALAGAVVLLHDESHGRVRERGGQPVAEYWPDRNDIDTMRRGIRELARMYFAAGAREVYLPFDGGQGCGQHELEQRIARGRIDRHRLPMSSVHPQGSCPAGKSARGSAVDPHAQVWGAPGVYVTDASIFPASVGVPPQVTIMSLARLIADHIADELPA